MVRPPSPEIILDCDPIIEPVSEVIIYNRERRISVYSEV